MYDGIYLLWLHLIVEVLLQQHLWNITSVLVVEVALQHHTDYPHSMLLVILLLLEYVNTDVSMHRLHHL